MKTSIQFEISLEDGVYTASGINAPIVTEAATFEELKENRAGDHSRSRVRVR